VIKPGFFPLFGAMTTVAVLAKCFSMDVVIFVAVITATWRFPELLSGFMTGITGDSWVAACEFEVGHFMIEGLAVQTGNIHIPTDMISVAAATLGVLDGAGSSMKAFFIGNITVNFFVTIQAQFCLFFLVKQAVAFPAAALVFRVSLDQWARHDQRFKQIRSCGVAVECGR
jgi:hypothetical protein